MPELMIGCSESKGKITQENAFKQKKKKQKSESHESEQVYISVHKVSQLFEVTLIPALYYCH